MALATEGVGDRAGEVWPWAARAVRGLLVGKSDALLTQLFRYTLVGGLAFLLDFSLLAVLVEWARLPVLLAATIAFVGGLLANYALSVRWIFARRRLRRPWLEFGLFAVIGVIGLGVNAATMFLFTTVLGVHYMIGKISSTVVVYLWNFIARKLALFSEAG
jgi:putative flippase GtrA